MRPLDEFKECAHCPEMTVLPSGRFMMGSPGAEEGRDEVETEHEVTIARRFAVGKFAVTFAQWDSCVAAGGCRDYRPNDRGWGRGDRPVIGLLWEDAMAFVGWLSDTVGRSYRLLSEAEREYATRAGTRTAFWWGSSLSWLQANYNASFSYGGGPPGDYRRKTVPVTSFSANPWGLYGVHGNVYEWVEDCWHATYDGAPADGAAWKERECRDFAFRGGAWPFPASHLRSASRGSLARALGHDGVGMRVARSLD